MKEQILAVRQMQDYIEAHLEEKDRAVGAFRCVPVFTVIFLSAVSGKYRADRIGIYPSAETVKGGFTRALLITAYNKNTTELCYGLIRQYRKLIHLWHCKGKNLGFYLEGQSLFLLQ